MHKKKKKQPDTPNIVVIMNESLADYSKYNSIDQNQDYLGFIHSIYEDTQKGTMVSPSFGGCTVNAEFEFLTGNSTRYWAGFNVYSNSTLINTESSLPYLFNQLGYRTIAMHPNTMTAYNRFNAYPRLGFVETIFIEQFDSAYKKGSFISDEGAYKKVFEIFDQKQDEKLFIF